MDNLVDDIEDVDVQPHPCLLDDDDLRFEVLLLSDLGTVHAATSVSRAWRATALRCDLRHWGHCDRKAFARFEPQEHPPKGWSCESIAELSAVKPFEVLDLTGVIVSSPQAAAALAAALPSTLHTLCIAGRPQDCAHPDAMLHALLSRVETLPRLRALDLRGIFTERSLAGVRLLAAAHARADKVGEALTLVRSMPALERLSIGFHCYTALGHREGEEYLRAQAALSPRLRNIGCLVPTSRLCPIDVRCRQCGTVLYRRLRDYLVHAPQQVHSATAGHAGCATLPHPEMI